MSIDPNTSRVIGEEQHPARRFFSYLFTLLTVIASVITIWPFFNQPQSSQAAVPLAPAVPAPAYIAPISPVVRHQGQACILEKTAVSAQVVGYTSRVTVTQVFRNPNSKRFDAVYTFPLSDTAAVDEMTMKIGKRVVRGSIKKKEDARAIYQAARQAGQTASLLEQQRTNIFTQSVANVDPGESIEITLKYTDTLAYENGKYELVFPTKVGPRFSPGDAASESLVTTVNQSVAGYEGSLSFDISIDAGMPISNVSNGFLSGARIEQTSATSAHVVKTNATAGSDFVLSWDVAANQIESGVVTHRDGTDGYLTAMIMPPQRVVSNDVAPKEMVFLIDCSGSQSGAPLDKAKETLHYIVEHMNAHDTFQIIAFSDNVRQFSPEPVSVSGNGKRRAHEFIEALTADGGTYMAPAIEKVCATRAPGNRLRIVSFMTDGFVSNDYEVISMVKRLRGNSRWFPFGTGNNVNRTLIDGIAKEGGGEPEYVMLDRDGKAIAKEFYDRISTPVLTDVKVRFENVDVQDVYPKQLADVWAQKPLYFHGRFKGFGKGTAVITGFAAGKPYEKRLNFQLPLLNTQHEAVAQTWARTKIDDLMSQDLNGVQSGTISADLKETITGVALKHHLVSQYTSFVAVDDAQKAATYADPHGERQLSSAAVQTRTQTQTASVPQVGFDPFGIKATVNQSFATTVNQLNALNAYSAVSTTEVNAPHLQGTTNGTIGPQGTDFTVISGVNTAGAVRTNPDVPANYTTLQLVALAIMWLASLQLLLRSFRKPKTPEAT